MPKRRAFLQSAAGLPALTSLAAAQNAPQAAPPRDYFRELGLRPFINAAGTYTTLTASLMPPEVMDAIHYASSRFVHLNLLQDAVGARIASLLGAEAAMVTSGAAGAMTVGTAGAMTVGTAGVLTGADPDKIRRLPDLTGMKSEVLIQKAHRCGYDHAVRATGVHLVELETEDDLRRAAGPQTAMMLFFNDAQSAAKSTPPAGSASAASSPSPPSTTPPPTPLPQPSSEYIRLGFDSSASPVAKPSAVLKAPDPHGPQTPHRRRPPQYLPYPTPSPEA